MGWKLSRTDMRNDGDAGICWYQDFFLACSKRRGLYSVFLRGFSRFLLIGGWALKSVARYVQNPSVPICEVSSGIPV